MDQQTIDALAEAVAERLLRELPRGRLPMRVQGVAGIALRAGFGHGRRDDDMPF